MTCHPILNEQGARIGFVCERGSRSKKTCTACSRTATKLCDFKLSGKRSGKTCDAPLCDGHAVSAGPDLDHCPAHAAYVAASATSAAAAPVEFADPLELAWRKGDPQGVLQLDFNGVAWCTMDPGARGVALAYRALDKWTSPVPEPVRMGAIEGRAGSNRFARRCAPHVRLAITEEPFVGRANVQSALVTARTAGFFQGAMQAALGEHQLTVITVPAQSWQASELPRSLGERPERKAEAVRLAELELGNDSRWKSANKELRSAIADAQGMARWWARLRRPELFGGKP